VSSRANPTDGIRDFPDFVARWEGLHGNVKATGVVLGWLRISFQVARGLSALRFTPNAITLIGVLFSVVLYLTSKSYFAIVFLLLSLIADGVDGSLALYSGRNSTQGALLDSVADRIAELFWALALIRIGSPIWLALALLVLANTQEYARARLLSLGNFETGIVTWGERPHRAIYLGLALALSHAHPALLTAFVLVIVVNQGISLVMVLRSAYSQIRAKDRLSD
jgi:phosphatidylglycerophosphate synthase